jgi:uncharacterized repeat protein (TIGR01451 family)
MTRRVRTGSLRAAAFLVAAALPLAVTTLAAPAARASAEDGPGYVRVNGWTTDDSGAVTTLPGNGAPFGEVRYSAPGQDFEIAENGAHAKAYPPWSSLMTEARGCITNRTTTGIPYACRSDSVTITLPRKMANPVLRLGLAGGAFDSFIGGTSQACVRGWPEATIRTINGAAPVTGDVTLVSTTSEFGGFQDGTFTLSQSNWRAEPCKGTSATMSVRLSGLVESITIDTTVYEMLTRLTSGYTYDGSVAPVGGMAVDFGLPHADLAMTNTGSAVVDADGDVTWDLAVTNNGPADSHGFVVQDAVPAEVTDARLVDAPAGCELRGRDLTCAHAPPSCTASGSTVVATWADLSCPPGTAITPVLGNGQTFGPITLTGTAPAPRGAQVMNTASVAGADIDPDTTNNTATALTTVEAPTLTIRKDVTERAAAQDQFTVQAADAGGAAVASATTSGTATTASSAPVQVRREEPYTISEAMAPGSVSAVDRYQATATCVDDSTGASVPARPTAAAWTFVPPENHPYTCVVTNTPAPEVTVRVAKVGESADGDVVRMAGSGFELLSDDDGRAGTPLDDPAAVETQTGLFEFTGLAPGTYWLRETVAPDGFALLAEPVPFTVSAAGVVSLTDPDAAPQVTADGDLLTVHDVPSFGLPEAGGPGPWALTVAGASLLALALALSAGRTRRVRRDTPQESRNNA